MLANLASSLERNTLTQLMGSPVRDPAYANPSVPVDQGSEVAQKMKQRLTFLEDIKLCKICKGTCVGNLLL